MKFPKIRVKIKVKAVVLGIFLHAARKLSIRRRSGILDYKSDERNRQRV